MERVEQHALALPADSQQRALPTGRLGQLVHHLDDVLGVMVHLAHARLITVAQPQEG